MATKKITFDPESGVAYAANFVLNGGSDFTGTFEVVDTSGTGWNFSTTNSVGIATTTGWTGSSQMTKSVSVGSTGHPAATFVVGIDTTSSTAGKVTISLGSTATRTLSEGRYVYDVIVSSGSTFYRIVDGTILVQPGISSAI
jgi:hypothetical protein|tara:strand:- start:2078 stop:2503 length:426 start_codon:yes stop_codon:yes gene_type:complete